MAFLNFLGNIGSALPQLAEVGGIIPGASPGFAGGQFGGIREMDGINQALSRNQQMSQQRAARKPKLGIAEIVGAIADAARGWKGQEPVYGPMMAEQRKQQARNAALSNYLDDPEGAIRALFAAGDPETALAVMKARGNQGEPFTLGENQARYDSQGNLIAQGPGKLDTVEIDGVVFDKRTGQPLFESPYSRIIPGQEGSFYEQPRQGIGRNRAPSSAQGGSDLRAQAEEAIRMGADPAEVNKRLQEMMGGATAGPSPIFP